MFLKAIFESCCPENCAFVVGVIILAALATEAAGLQRDRAIPENIGKGVCPWVIRGEQEWMSLNVNPMNHKGAGKGVFTILTADFKFKPQLNHGTYLCMRILIHSQKI